MGFLPAVRNWLDLDWVEDPRQMIYMWNVLTATWITWVWLGFCWSPVGVCTRFLASFNSFVEQMKFIIMFFEALPTSSNVIVVHGSSGNWIDGISGGSKMAAPPLESDVDGMPMAYHITPDRDIGYVCQAWLKTGLNYLEFLLELGSFNHISSHTTWLRFGFPNVTQNIPKLVSVLLKVTPFAGPESAIYCTYYLLDKGGRMFSRFEVLYY